MKSQDRGDFVKKKISGDFAKNLWCFYEIPGIWWFLTKFQESMKNIVTFAKSQESGDFVNNLVIMWKIWWFLTESQNLVISWKKWLFYEIPRIWWVREKSGNFLQNPRIWCFREKKSGDCLQNPKNLVISTNLVFFKIPGIWQFRKKKSVDSVKNLVFFNKIPRI